MSAWKHASLIFTCAAVAAAVTAVVHPRRPPWFTSKDPSAARWKLSVEAVRRLAEEEEPFWIDARSRADYEMGHLPGALLLNREEWGELMFENQFALQEAFGRPVVVYCDGEACQRSEEVAQDLRDLLGLEPVFVLVGSWRDLLP